MRPKGWSWPARHYVPPRPGATLVNTFEGGSNGVTLTGAGSGNTGGVSGNSFDVVTSAGATLAFDSTRTVHGGGMSCQVATVASAASFTTWSTSMGSQPQMWFRVYLYFTAFPANTHKIVTFRQGAALCGYVQLNTAGTFGFLDAANSSIFGATAVIPLNQWFRIEGYLYGGNGSGQAELKLFTSADSANAAQVTTSAATQNTRGAPDNVRFGVETAVANAGPFWMDDPGASSAGYLGPAAGAGPFYPLNRPVRAQVVNLQPGTVSHRAGPYGQPGAPLRPLQRPAGARLRVLPPAGHVTRAAGIYGGLGPAVRALASAVAGRLRGLPPRGRTAGRSGVYAQAGPPVRGAAGPVQARRLIPRGGRAAGRAGTFTAAAPATGPPVYPLGHPVQSRQLPLRGGRTVSRAGTLTAGAPQAGPPVYPPGRPVQARAAAVRGGSVTRRTGPVAGTGPRVPALKQPAGCYRRQLPPPASGRVLSLHGLQQPAGAPAYPLHRPVRGQPQRPVLTGRTSSRTGTFTFVAPPAFTVGALSAATAPAASLTAQITASLDSIYTLTYGAAYTGGGTPVPRLTTSTDPAAMLAAVSSAAGIPDNPVYATVYATYYGITPGGLLSATDAKAGGPG